MPNSSDKSFSDYVKRVDPELYKEMEGRYNNATGGYDMPNSSDKSFSDYVKRVDPELYKEMEGIYNDATRGY